MPYLAISLFISALAFSGIVSAAEDPGAYKPLTGICDHLLSGPLQVKGSGRDQDVLPEFKRAAVELTELARSLGMATPPHQLIVVPAPQMNLLASLGRHSSPHWYDGYMLLQNLKSSGNILEFVTKGCSVCRSYYSDLNTPNAQISIIMHVLGHNDVSAHSQYMAAVKYDPMSSSAVFAQRVQQLYDNYDHDEVSLFVQWLFSTEYMQDLAMSTFDHPDFFKSHSEDIRRVEHFADPARDNPYGSDKAPRRKSPNILQALTQAIPPGAPAWKRELIDLFEKSRRYISGNVATKIMNEGWATFSQFILARHSKFISDQHVIEFGALLAGVAYPDLKNPYFLGLESWWHLWEKFRKREDVKALSPFEQDKKFIAYAHEILRTHDDYEFIETALDQDWVSRKKLMLYRPLAPGDKQPKMSEEFDPSEYNIALSRDSRRIIRYIQRLVAAKHLNFPRVHITDLNWQRQGIVRLEHEMFEGIPLRFDSAIRTLFVLAQVFERPVLLESHFGNGMGGSSPLIPVLVEPNGKVKVRSTNVANGPYEEAAQKIVDEFKETLKSVVNEDFQRARLDESWKTAIAAAMDQILAPIQKTMLYAPYADSSIVEYNNLVERLIMGAAKSMIQKGQQPRVNGGKVLFNVLPDIPHFELDVSVRKVLINQKPPAPVDLGVYAPQGLDVVGQDDPSALGAGPYLPGEIFKRKSEKKGRGNGKGDPSDSDGEPDDSEPGEIGNGGGDIAMPVDFWGKLLNAELELPNLRRTEGESREVDRIRRGTARRPKGYELDEHTLMNAIEKAISIRKGRNLPYRIGPELDRQTLVREALILADRSDTVVSDHMNIPIPDFKAVLVVIGDLTGSMSGERIEMAKQLIFNIKALLKAQYKEIEIRYVGFSGHAEEFEEENFFNSFFGGGTSYVAGLSKGRDILKTYATSEWNKFVLLVGDGESNDQAGSIQVLDEMTPDLQFFSFAVTTGSYGFSIDGNDFVKAFAGYKEKWPWVGIAELKNSSDSIRALKKLYPKVDKPNR